MPRYFLLAVTAAMLPAVPTAAPSAATVTQWHVRGSLALDTVLFTGVLSGDELQREYYEKPVQRFRARLDADALAAIERVGETAADEGFLAGPILALVFSAGPCATIDDLVASARAPEERLRPALEASAYWDAERWIVMRERIMPELLKILPALREAGFEDYWRGEIEPVIAARAAGMAEYLAPYDVIAEQRRLLGRPLERGIEVLLLEFSKPYGIRITGQRFLSHHSNDVETQLRIAAHEIFHPPFDTQDEALLASLAPLREDPWMRSIVEDHDPSFGYNSFKGLLNEDSTEALDQIVSERLGVARDPGERWRRADDGMHMLAAAIYQMLLEDEFDAQGGSYAAWLEQAIDRGLFAPAEVRRRAALVVGEDAVNRWPVAGGSE